MRQFSSRVTYPLDTENLIWIPYLGCCSLHRHHPVNVQSDECPSNSRQYDALYLSLSFPLLSPLSVDKICMLRLEVGLDFRRSILELLARLECGVGHRHDDKRRDCDEKEGEELSLVIIAVVCRHFGLVIALPLSPGSTDWLLD